MNKCVALLEPTSVTTSMNSLSMNGKASPTGSDTTLVGGGRVAMTA